MPYIFNFIFYINKISLSLTLKLFRKTYWYTQNEKSHIGFFLRSFFAIQYLFFLLCSKKHVYFRTNWGKIDLTYWIELNTKFQIYIY